MFTLSTLTWKGPDFECNQNGIYEAVPLYKDIFFATLFDLAIGISCVTVGALTHWSFSQILIGIGAGNTMGGVICLASIIRDRFAPNFLLIKGKNSDAMLAQINANG